MPRNKIYKYDPEKSTIIEIPKIVYEFVIGGIILFAGLWMLFTFRMWFIFPMTIIVCFLCWRGIGK